MVDGRRLGELPREGVLQRAQLGLQGAPPAVELALGAESGEVAAQVRLSKAPEVAVAAEAEPLGEIARQGLTVGKQGRTAGAAWGR